MSVHGRLNMFWVFGILIMLALYLKRFRRKIGKSLKLFEKLPGLMTYEVGLARSQ